VEYNPIDKTSNPEPTSHSRDALAVGDQLNKYLSDRRMKIFLDLWLVRCKTSAIVLIGRAARCLSVCVGLHAAAAAADMVDVGIGCFQFHHFITSFDVCYLFNKVYARDNYICHVQVWLTFGVESSVMTDAAMAASLAVTPFDNDIIVFSYMAVAPSVMYILSKSIVETIMWLVHTRQLGSFTDSRLCSASSIFIRAPTCFRIAPDVDRIAPSVL